MLVDGSLMRSATEPIATYFDCIEKDKVREENQCILR